ncbi:hypothetical protein CIK90_06940 [Prevotella sp. P5-126]|nr:hypothetical protein CIK90_06940 [Prevotella sp. P5-126]
MRIIFNKNFFCVLRVLSVFRGFLVAYGKKSLEEILFKMLLRKKYCGFAVDLQIKSLTKIIDQNALEFLAFGEGFILDRIGDARNLN